MVPLMLDEFDLGNVSMAKHCCTVTFLARMSTLLVRKTHRFAQAITAYLIQAVFLTLRELFTLGW